MSILPLTLVLASLGGEVPLELSLEDCIRMAMGRNLSVRAAALDAEAGREGFRASWGAFDTVFFVNSTASAGRNAPSAGTVVGGIPVGDSPATDVTFFDLRTGWRGQLLGGTSWSLEVGPRRIKTQTTDFTSDIHTADWSFEVTRPLLRNGADDYARSTLELAAHDASLAGLQAESVATSTVQEVVVAYWNLVFTRRNLETVELSVTLATELVEITRRKRDQGLQNRIDVVEVEAELARRREELLTARHAREEALDALRTLVLAPATPDAWRGEIVPVTEPEEARPDDAAADEEAVQTALARRPDVREARLRVDRAQVEVRRAENQVRPRFDLTGSYGLNSNDEHLFSSVRALDDTTFNTASLSVAFEVPIGNRGAGYALRQARLALLRLGVNLQDTQMKAVQQVRGALRGVRLQRERVVATAETSRLNLEVYEGEKRRLENDLSTPFKVRETLRDWLQAVDSEERARLDLQVARSTLLQAQGALLDHYGLGRPLPELSLEEAPPAP